MYVELISKQGGGEGFCFEKEKEKKFNADISS